jgi:hypothetical protein
MAKTELSFADGFYIDSSTSYMEKRAVNVFPVIPAADAPTKRRLNHTPGIIQDDSVTGANSRGVLVFSDGTPYRVIGTSLYSFSSSGTSTNRGTIAGTADVSMDSNGINIAIQDPEGASYFYTPITTTLEANNSAAFTSFGQATSVTFKGGYYVYTTDSKFFVGSASTTNDGKTFNALDFEDAEISPDNIVRGYKDHNQLYIIGDSTTEVYRNIVTDGFPLERIPGAVISKGCSARNTVIPWDNSFLMLGGGKNEKPGIYQVLGSGVKKVSTESVDTIIHSNSTDQIAAARGFSYSENGNYFAVFTVGFNTLVYDQVTSARSGKAEWHERQTGITNGKGFKGWRAIHGALAYGSIQVGDDRSGLVGRLDKGTYKEYGNDIERVFTTKPFMESGDKIFSGSVELYMQTGLGNDDIEDPQIRFDYSDDGSRTFSNEAPVSMGKRGEHKTRVRWRRLGGFPLSRVLRWKTTAPVPVDVYGLYADARITTNA